MSHDLKQKTKEDYSAISELYITDFSTDHSHFELIDELIQLQRERRLLLKPTFDLGCGPATITSYLINKGLSNIVAVDITPEFCEYVEEKFKNPPPFVYLQVIEGDMVDVVNEALVTHKNCTAAVIAGFSIIHIPDNEVDSLLNSIFKLLCPGGLFYMSCHEGTHKGMQTEPYSMQNDKRLKTQERLEVYMNYFTESELQKRIENAGFQIRTLDRREADVMPGEIPVAKLQVLAEKSLPEKVYTAEASVETSL